MLILPGLIGTGDWAADSRPETWIKTLLRYRPNAKASMSMFMGMKQSKAITDPTWHWPEKDIRVMRFTSNSATDSATSIVFQGTTPIKGLRDGHILRNSRTEEVIWIDANPSAPYTTISCIRGGSTGSTAYAVNSGDTWLLIGTRNAEGGPHARGIFREPEYIENNCQIFKTAVEVTNTAAETELRWAPNGPTKEQRFDALEDFYQDVEAAGIWGVPHVATNPANGKPERTTGGMFYFVTTNVVDFGGSFGLSDFMDWLRLGFHKGSSRKLLVTGDLGLLTLFMLVQGNSQFNVTADTKAWGMNVSLLRTPWGEAIVKRHDMLTESVDYADSLLLVDTKNLAMRHLRNRDTKLERDVVKDGTDQKVDQYIGEIGWEWALEETHAIAHNFTGYNP